MRSYREDRERQDAQALRQLGQAFVAEVGARPSVEIVERCRIPEPQRGWTRRLRTTVPEAAWVTIASGWVIRVNPKFKVWRDVGQTSVDGLENRHLIVTEDGNFAAAKRAFDGALVFQKWMTLSDIFTMFGIGTSGPPELRYGEPPEEQRRREVQYREYERDMPKTLACWMATALR